MGLLSKWVESLDYEYEILKSCSRHQSPRSECKHCREGCDEDALAFVHGKPVIDKEKCKECGKCMAACPVQAIAGIFPQRTVIQHHLLVTKEHLPTVKELLVYYKKGITSIVCEPDLPEEWKQIWDEANQMLGQLGETPLSAGKLEKETAYTRRDLFSFWKKETKTFMHQWAPAKWRFNHQDLDVARYYPNHQFTEIRIDVGKCTLCQACQKLCAKQCLEVTDSGFSVAAQSCSACGLCQDICPEKAIAVKKRISTARKEEYPIFKKRCVSCNSSYPTLSSEDGKCVMCIKREEYLSIGVDH